MRGPAWETFLGEPFDIGGGLDDDGRGASRWATRTSCCFVEDDPAPCTSGTSGRRSSATSCSRSARTSSSRTWTTASCTQGLGARRRRDDGVRQRRVRGRGRRQRGRASCRRARRSGSPAATSRWSGATTARSCSTGTRHEVFEGAWSTALGVRRDGERRRVGDGLADRLAARTARARRHPLGERHERAVLARDRRADPERLRRARRRRRRAVRRAAGPPGRHAVRACWRGTSTRSRSPATCRADAVDGAIVGRGAADMKGALAVMLELAVDARARRRLSYDVGLLFFGREELPILAERPAARSSSAVPPPRRPTSPS